MLLIIFILKVLLTSGRYISKTLIFGTEEMIVSSVYPVYLTQSD